MRIFLLLAFCAVVVAGCARGPAKPDADQLALAEAARADMQAGNYGKAAEQFKQLADDSRGELAAGYRIDAAEAFLQADELTDARLQLERVELSAEEHPLLFVRERLLAAQLALASDDTGMALERLDSAYPPATHPLLRGEYHLLRARAYEQQERTVAAITERLAADQALRDQPVRLQHAGDLWHRLRQLDAVKLNELRKDATPAATGWLNLALIDKAGLTDPANLRRTLDDWQLQYPDHPGVDIVLPELRQLADNIGRIPRKVALVLPFSSAYSEAARIIRDGFLAAWYQDKGKRPIIRVYDAGQQNIVSVYNEAITDGADMVVGPLQKEAVNTLVNQGLITVPTLALNYYEGDPAAVKAINQIHRLPLLYQFSLSPEQEARQIAERAWFDGHARALAVTPANEWGDRIYNAFSKTFEELGGKILERITYRPEKQDYSAAVQALLNIDNSQQRYKALRDQLQRSLESEPRRRQDADFIMLAGYSTAGRQIGPQLLFHRAADLPVYTTSHIYTGVSNRSADADMNGFIFADMPWLLDPAQEQTSIYQDIKRYWPKRMEGSPRLYALGIDAYRLLPQLSRMALDQSARFAGVTGHLSLSESARIERHLQWARFVNGLPRSLDDGSMAARR